MNEKTAGSRGKPARPGRDDRLKAALKANMARRKAQARARSADRDDKSGETGDTKAED
ncbi:MAG: hypothetical protein KDK53_02365 [Maritimibacter sp.]|nr:hypothetical protein [Maritimibacter sp.]